MIKNFEHVMDGRRIPLCVTLADGPEGQRAVISHLESAQAIVMMDVAGVIGMLKSAVESPDEFLDHAVRKAGEEGLIDLALRSGEPQTGSI
jgi:hypothetical protein